jgi:hypothetical protein
LLANYLGRRDRPTDGASSLGAAQTKKRRRGHQTEDSRSFFFSFFLLFSSHFIQSTATHGARGCMTLVDCGPLGVTDSGLWFERSSHRPAAMSSMTQTGALHYWQTELDCWLVLVLMLVLVPPGDGFVGSVERQ